MITTVMRFKNGMVMVFDEKGEQMPEFQGRFEEVHERIEQTAGEKTKFIGWETPILWRGDHD